MSTQTTIEGGCLCGATRYRVSNKPYKRCYCYCRWCVGATGAPVVAWTLFDDDSLRFTAAEPKRFPSSPGVIRSFCKICGTPLSWEGRWDDRPVQMVTTASLDDPEAFPPDRHASCHNRIGWFDTADDHPRYDEGAPPD